MKHFYGVFVFLLITQLSFSQNKSLLQFYYGINKTETTTSFLRLDSLLSILGKDTCLIHISGYADYLGSDSANRVLSQRREEAIRNHIVEHNSTAPFYITGQGYGEVHSKDKSPRSLLGDPLNRRVDVEITRPAPKTKQVKIPDTGMITPAKTLEGIELLKKGESMPLEGLSFIPGRHIWLPSSEVPLSNLLYTLKTHTDLSIEIQGHICCVYAAGDALDFDTNERSLSTNRARAVYDYLVTRGIDASRLRYKGYGHTMPKVAEERTSQDEQTNRRVEIKILD